jgi:hypothetical protein
VESDMDLKGSLEKPGETDGWRGGQGQGEQHSWAAHQSRWPGGGDSRGQTERGRGPRTKVFSKVRPGRSTVGVGPAQDGRRTQAPSQRWQQSQGCPQRPWPPPHPLPIRPGWPRLCPPGMEARLGVRSD